MLAIKIIVIDRLYMRDSVLKNLAVVEFMRNFDKFQTCFNILELTQTSVQTKVSYKGRGQF